MSNTDSAAPAPFLPASAPVPGGARFSRLIGVGAALPARRVTNDDLVADLATRGIETSDEWIVTRTGIRQRWLAGPDDTTTSLGVRAAREAMKSAGVGPDDIDLIVCATSTADQIFPSTACLIQSELGVHQGGAFDVQAVCSGFAYAVANADALIRAGVAQRALVIGAEVFSRILDWNDRSTCVLFGDGAGAIVLSAADTPGVLVSRLHADGRQSGILSTPGSVRCGAVTGHPFLRMDGQAVFKLAVKLLAELAQETLEAAGLKVDDLDWLVPHQANVRILSATASRLGLPLDRVISTVGEHANTSAASVPLALAQAVQEGRLRPGQLIMLQGVGGGFTWASNLIRL
ncbi:ketoacyl-ACP synthase III [Lautropia dentalis]|uniref:Beta-ketoacyl-[acyl-carrier-protein] synthase III n=1 Tax=Lautropia dentalis TaxID=2490857 RepID=A0A426FTA1_9BURK|nr:beta-ketoacyl-ACP synthase III [Lautropia dentalis]RRN45887.1 ketoacyl-ACP synthase III [Lautropia dentalis]